MINFFAKYQHLKIIGHIFNILLKFIGLYIPRSVSIGRDVCFVHNAVGTVIHPCTSIEDNVTIYQGVTLGRSDIYRPYSESKMKGFLIEENAIICAGAKILCKKDTLTIGKNTIIGANAVLLNSTGPNEIWVGNPAKLIGYRQN